MSNTRQARAAVFTGQPPDVEVYRGGSWVTGSLLGWRHDADGGCQLTVRLPAERGGVTFWTGLDSLRLPQRHPTAAPQREAEREPHSAGSGGVRALRGVPPAGPAARAMAIPGPPVPTGRAAHPVGRGRAPQAGAAPVAAVAPRSVGRSVGRHRAPVVVVVAGRHRVADTGARPVSTEQDATREMPGTWSFRADRAGQDRGGLSAVPGAFRSEPDLPTHPMRRDAGLAGRRDAGLGCPSSGA